MDVRAQNRPRSTGPSAPSPSNIPTPSRPRRTLKRWLLGGGILVGAALLILGALLWCGFFSNTEKAIDKTRFQAVFLANNQVYFGHVKHIQADYIELSDVYYLQVQTSAEDQPKTAGQVPTQASLAKLGDEAHGPDGTMYIAKGQVLFWENLKNDSKVVEAINELQKK